MIFENEKKILKVIKYAPLIFILIVSLVFLSIQFIEKNSTFEKEKIKIQNEYLNRNKQLIKERVYEVYDYIQNERKFTEQNLKASLDLAITNANAIAKTIYENNKDKDKKIVKKLIIDALRNIRFNNGRGYYFIYDNKGINYLLPHNIELEGKNFWNHKDSKGTPIVQNMINNLKKEDKSFLEWYWFNPLNPDIQKKKIGLVSKFEPFDWFIGTGEYIEDFEIEVQNRLLEHIRNIRFGENGYIFIINYDSIYLSHIRKEFWGKNAVTNNDAKDIKRVITDLINLAKNGEGYYNYTQNKKPGIEQATSKTSFVKGLNDWSWMIGSGFYQDDMEKSIQHKKAELDANFRKNLIQTIQISFLLTFTLFLFSIYFSKILHKRFEKYKKEIENHIKTNAEQHNLLSHQSKMAAMGEMIGNIAHQWRQPLSVISTTSTGLKLQKELKMLEDEFLLNGLDGINNTAQYLSTTIDDFRNFFKIHKEKVAFDIKDAIEKALSLIDAQFKSNEIVVIKNIDNIEILNFKNELIQVIINILNNAKDELIKKETTFKKFIFINAHKEADNLIIEIKDNACGVPLEIIDRIFEPYFSTKHQFQGTGIGLHMSREIITKNMQGDIKVFNSTFTYDNIQYTVAIFKITLPIEKENL